MLPTAIYQCVVNRLSGSRAVQRVRGAVVKSGDDEDQSSPRRLSSQSGCHGQEIEEMSSGTGIVSM